MDTSKLVRDTELPETDTNYHRVNRFYAHHLMQKPEFRFQNHLVELKAADLELLETALKEEEAEELKRAALASQGDVVSQQPVKGGKVDPKAKAPPAKAKGVVEVDKNAPKPIEIDYPPCEAEPSFLLIEKAFNYAKVAPVPAPANAPAALDRAAPAPPPPASRSRRRQCPHSDRGSSRLVPRGSRKDPRACRTGPRARAGLCTRRPLA